MKYQNQSILNIAMSRGSQAKTKSGAWKYLLSHLPYNPRFASIGSPNFGAFEVRSWAQPKRKGYERKRTEIRAGRIASALHLWTKEDAEAESIRLSNLDSIQSLIEQNFPYRRASGNWAGGKLRVEINLGSPNCDGYAERAWSKNGKWQGNNSVAEFTITARAIQFGCVRPEGIILDAVQLGPREYEIWFARQGRGFQIYAQYGFMIKGYLSEKASIELARKDVKKKRTQTLSLRVMQRQKKADTRKEHNSLSSVWVTREDSIAAGNCPTGTEREATRITQWLGSNGLVGAIRADVLLNITDTIYVRRAITHARNR